MTKRSIPKSRWPAVKRILTKRPEPKVRSSLHIWEEIHKFARGRTLHLYFALGAPDDDAPEMEIVR